jgi:predicted cation transporter
MTRTVSHSLHAAVEILGGVAVMAAPFVLGLGRSAAIISVVLGALAIGAALQIGGPERRVPLTAHASFDYVLATFAIVAGLALGIASGEWRATVFLVGVGVGQAALTASTRWSVPAGA